MDIKKSLNWLNKRFKSAKEHKYSSFKVNEHDFNAFNSIVEYVSIVNKEKVSKNVLFAKLYIYFLNQQIRYFQTDAFEKIPVIELNKFLDTPLDNYYVAFHKELHSAKISNTILKYKQGYKPTKEEFENKYSLQFVTEQLDLMMNQALNRFEE